MAGGKNKAKGPSNSARAAAFLNKNAGSNTSPGLAGVGTLGFGFGAALKPEAAHAQVDPEIAQCLKHVTKRDENTKLKALNILLSKFEMLEADAAAELMPAWLFAYKRVSLDNARAVRLAGARALSRIVHQAGRKLAPHLKELMGCWWLAMFDTYSEAKQAAHSAFEACFATVQKRRQAIVHARSVLIGHLRDSMFASAEDLGEPSKESAEELADRHQRVCTQALFALTGIAELFPAEGAASVCAATASSSSTPGSHADTPKASNSAAPPGNTSTPSTEERESIIKSMSIVWEDQAFWRRALEDNRPAVYSAACHFVSQFVQVHADTALKIQTVLAPLVYSSLQSSPGGCQNAAWSMTLRFTAACPGGLSVPSVSTSLPRQISSLLKAGQVNPAFASSIVPLTLQMLRHGPSDWQNGVLGRLWLPAALKGFQNAPAAILSRTAEVLAALLLVMVSQAPRGDQSGEEVAASVLREVSASVKSSTFVKALWEVLGNYVATPESRFEPAAKMILDTYSVVAQDKLAGASTEATESMVAQVMLLADLTCSAAAPPHTAQLTRSMTLLPLIQALRTLALLKPLTAPQAQVLHRLLCSCAGKSGSSASATEDGEELLQTCVSRVLAVDGLQPPDGASQVPEAAADLLIIKALLECGAVSVPAVLDTALSHTLPSSADAAVPELLSAGHTLQSFRKACTSCIAEMQPHAAQTLSHFVQLVLQGSIACGFDKGPDASSQVGEVILLLLLGFSLLPEGSAAGAEMLRSPAALALQRLADPGTDAGLMYMLAVLFREAAVAARSAAEDISEGTAQLLMRAPVLLPCAAHCCRACAEAPATLRNFSSIRHCEAVICAVFELAIPQVVGHASDSAGAPGVLALQKVAAATWARLVQPLQAAAATLAPGLPAELMRVLVAWHTRCSPCEHASEAGTAEAGGDTGPGPALMRELPHQCQLAGATAMAALDVLDVACNHSDTAAAEQSVASLMHAPSSSPPPPDAMSAVPRSMVDDIQASLPQAQLLLAASVLLRSKQQRLLDAWSNYVPWLALVSCMAGGTWPSDFRNALTKHLLAAGGHSACQALEVVQQLVRLACARDSSSSTALEALDALLRRPSAAVSHAAAAAFAHSRADLPRHVVATEGAQPSTAAHAVSALTPHVYEHARTGNSDAAAARDEVAVELLQHISDSAPMLTLPPPGPAGIMSAMRCVAQLYVPVPEVSVCPMEDSAGAELMAALAGSALHEQSALAGGLDDDSAGALPEEGGAGVVAAAGDGERVNEAAAPHAALVHADASERVRHGFAAAAAHQLRPARAVSMAASMPSDEAGDLLHLLLAAAAVAPNEQAISENQEQLHGLVEARLSLATVAIEAHTEDVCESLVAAAHRVAMGGADDSAREGEGGSAQQTVAVVMQLGWTKPRQAAALLGDVDAAAGAAGAADATPIAAVQLFLQLRELDKVGAPRGPDTAVPAVVQRIERLLLRLLLCAGSCMHVARMLQAPAATAELWLPGGARWWQLVAQAVLLHVHDSSVEKAVQEFTAWSGELGVPAMHAALGLMQYKETSAAMHAAGALIALAPSLLDSAAEAGAGREENSAEDAVRDSATRLVAAGVDAALAQALAGCRPLSVADCDAPLLIWSVMLARIEGLSNDARRQLAVTFAACDPPLVPCMLDLIVLLLPSADSEGGVSGDPAHGPPPPRWGIAGHVRETLCESRLASPWHHRGAARLSTHDVSALSVGIFRSLLRQIPAALRSWFSMLKDAQLAHAVEEYTRLRESPPLLRQDIEAAAQVKSDGMVITASGTAREVVASMEVDDGVMLELAIRLPPCYPLQPAEVVLRRRVAIQEKSLRRWMLSIAAYLRSQNCSLADAVLLWKSNVDQEFAGVEPCMICYSVVNPSDRSLPKMQCKTCSQIFHSVCLYKWFKSRSKSICPHCQCPW